MLIWDKVKPPFGSRFCRFWAEVELEYMPQLGAGVNHWRMKRWSRPNNFLSSSGEVSDEAVFLPGGQPVQRVKFHAGNPAEPVMWLDCLNSAQGVFPASARAGEGCINTKVNSPISATSPPFQAVNMEWQMLDRRADPPADNQLWVGVGAKYSGTLPGFGAEAAHGVVWNAGTGKGFYFQTTTSKVAVGLGASTGLVLAIMVCNHPSQLVGAMNEGADFSLALGAKWSNFIKAANNTKAGFAVLKSVGSILKASPTMQRSAKVLLRAGVPATLGGDGVEALANLAKTLASTSGMDSSSAGFSLFDIPVASPGLEIGISYGFQSMDYVEFL
jgi:hypothetical protein